MGATASFPEKKTTAPALRNHNGMSKAHSERTLDGDKSSFLSPFRISTTEGIIRVAGIFFSCDLESLRCCEMKSRIQRICVDLVHNGLLVLLNANNDDSLMLLSKLSLENADDVIEKEIIPNRLSTIASCSAAVVVLTKSYVDRVQNASDPDDELRNELVYLMNTKSCDQIVPVIAEADISKETSHSRTSWPWPLGELMRQCQASVVDFSSIINPANDDEDDYAQGQQQEQYATKIIELQRAIQAAMERGNNRAAVRGGAVKRSRSGSPLLSRRANEALKAAGGSDDSAFVHEFVVAEAAAATSRGAEKQVNGEEDSFRGSLTPHRQIMKSAPSIMVSLPSFESAASKSSSSAFGTVELAGAIPVTDDETTHDHISHSEADEELRQMEDMLLFYDGDGIDDDDELGALTGRSQHKSTGSTPRLSATEIQPLLGHATGDGAVEDLVEKLRKTALSPDDRILCQDALASIVECVYGDQHRQGLLEQRQDFLGYFINIFEYHLVDPEVCAFAIRALTVLCRCDDDVKSSSLSIIALFGTNGALNILVKAMKKHAKSDEFVAEHGCRAIHALCFASPDNQRKFSEKGVSDIIVNCLLIHPHTSAVVEQACKAIRNFTLRNADNAIQICQRGAPAAIVHAIEANNEYFHVAVQGCCALACLTSASKRNLHSLYAAGAHRAAITALNAFPDQPQISECATEVIAGLALEGEKAVEGLCASGCCEAVVEILKQHYRIAAVAEFSCRALVRLSVYPVHIQERLRHRGAASAVVSALRTHKTNTSVITEACWAIINVTIGDMELKREFIDAGVKSILITICRDSSVPIAARDWALEVLGEMY